MGRRNRQIWPITLFEGEQDRPTTTRKPVEKCDGVHIFEANQPNYRLSDAGAQILSGAVSGPPGHRLDKTPPAKPSYPQWVPHF